MQTCFNCHLENVVSSLFQLLRASPSPCVSPIKTFVSAYRKQNVIICKSQKLISDLQQKSLSEILHEHFKRKSLPAAQTLHPPSQRTPPPPSQPPPPPSQRTPLPDHQLCPLPKPKKPTMPRQLKKDAALFYLVQQFFH